MTGISQDHPSHARCWPLHKLGSQEAFEWSSRIGERSAKPQSLAGDVLKQERQCRCRASDSQSVVFGRYRTWLNRRIVWQAHWRIVISRGPLREWGRFGKLVTACKSCQPALFVAHGFADLYKQIYLGVSCLSRRASVCALYSGPVTVLLQTHRNVCAHAHMSASVCVRAHMRAVNQTCSLLFVIYSRTIVCSHTGFFVVPEPSYSF